MMLQIAHRESHDVDIFLSDPQLLPFLDPQKQDFKFEILPSEYQGDGNRFLKLAFEAIGEIDFVVAGPKTTNPTIEREIEGVNVLLETIPEIIAKKIVYRGKSIKPRDIFDIAAAGVDHSADLIRELNPYRQNVIETIAQIDKLNPEFVRGAIDSLIIRDDYRGVAAKALDRTKEILRAV
ncbi:nucleotidyl transferase AbiEii/AbiGii toxin family protein [Bradyrhizobium pachyrhizi]|uniref:nucleotidyl transferase AbiEii/AbiGii toxin family protein n=1 Tax=Bradyrhizobium TaxID=374 RepID=UPI0024B1DB96|nr:MULTISPECIES: nucleotidyl transferase AbiEii/AbiGii toxin family protein [Bradyrhizobium]WFU54845.1 nucleotidyl transferase AbiEii/AbiGii toxin family protein [Bradyrhizobium pachyrhizi]WOH80635.1 nucleotidyl transferase AbiEii/AbiGii toxin family protein [Bradyrhizobium sp. BEA-2-5]